MQLFSFGSFYLGIDEDKYCDLSLHVGRVSVEYQCPNSKSKNELRPNQQGGDGLSNGEIGTSN